MFDDIRPFNDNEVKSTLHSLLNDPDLARAISAWFAPNLHRKAPWLVRSPVRWLLKSYFFGVQTVAAFQSRLAPFVGRLLQRSVEHFSVHGLEKLDKSATYLFISNHRDIVMDPTMVNWALYKNGFQTVRIAIGDNLLSRPFSSKLMRLNKSFIVKRGLSGLKARLQAAKELSLYIHYSILQERANVWIAQREGRSKDGYDCTNSAVIGMLSLSKPDDRSYSDYIQELNIVPVAISYELDPLDLAKARELYSQETKGRYKKRKNEDLTSIARGMTGWKGSVHLEFGEVLTGHFASDAEVTAAIDAQIHRIYRPFATNEWAERMLQGEETTITCKNVTALQQRVAAARDELKPYLLKQYANGMRMQRGDKPL